MIRLIFVIVMSLGAGHTYALSNLSGYSLSGVASLGDCSGSVVQFINQKENEQAYLMTNGHCVGRPPSMGTAVYNKSVSRRFFVHDNTGNLFQVDTKLLVYATMTGTDIAFYQLEQTINEIKKVARVFVVDNAPAAIGEQLTVSSGFWAKSWECQLEETLFQLKEDEWTWVDSLFLGGNDCKMIDGASGAPIISNKKDTIVGIWNTWNEKGGQCQLNNPCEVDELGQIKVVYLRRYGQQTWKIYSCLNPKNMIDLTLPGCLLETNYVGPLQH